jgi:hypothetical protein
MLLGCVHELIRTSLGEAEAQLNRCPNVGA